VDKYLWIGLAGALGALARYQLGAVVQKAAGTSFPWSTIVINILGCFLFGLVWSLATDRGLISPDQRTILLAGFMGAFTTFSTFAFETQTLLGDGQNMRALANVAVQVVIGIAAIYAGIALGRSL
jgi:fluoride exporter